MGRPITKTSRAPFVTAGVIACAVACTALASTGCGNQCDTSPNEPPTIFKGGKTERGVYDSAGSWSGEYLDFPPGRTYRFYHGLDGCPATIQPWFAFAEKPVASSNAGPQPSGTSPAAGNQLTVLRVTSTTFDVWNDTCSDVRLRVTASDPEPCPGSTLDAGQTSTDASQLKRDAGP